MRRDSLDRVACAWFAACDPEERFDAAVAALSVFRRGGGRWRKVNRYAHRQAVVMAMVAEGFEEREIAERLGCSPRTIAADVAVVRATLGVSAVGSHG